MLTKVGASSSGAFSGPGKTSMQIATSSSAIGTVSATEKVKMAENSCVTRG